MNFKTKKILAVAVDCGFDGVKIDINKHLYSFPSYIIPMDAEKELIANGNSNSDKIIYSELVSNQATQSYVIGSTAQTLINDYPEDGEHRALIDSLKDLDEFFTMKEAVYLIRSAVAYAIVKYSEDNDIGFSIEKMDSYKIYLELPLPHSIKNEAFGYLQGPLSKQTEIVMQINQNRHHIVLDIASENIYSTSQVLSVFNNYIFTEDGNIIPNLENVFDILPAIIVDGGYRTQGLASIRKDSSLLVDRVESYEDYSMIEVNKQVAKIINDKAHENELDNYNPIREYDIDEYIATKSNFVYDIKDDSAKLGKRRFCVDFKAIEQLKKDVIIETAENYSKFLINDYGIRNAKTIIIAGGTGAAFASTIIDYINDYDSNIDVKLVENNYNGRIESPAFSIVIGAHENLLNIISAKE